MSDNPKKTTAYLPHVAKGATINFSGAVVRTVITYGYAVLLARLLPVNELGWYWMLFTIISIASLTSTLGLDLGIVRYVSLYAGEGKLGQAKKTLGAGVILGLPAGIITALILYFLAPWLSEQLLESSSTATTSLRIFALSVPLWVAVLLFNATTQGLHRMRYQVYSRDMGEQSSRFILTAVLGALGAGLIGVVWANVAALAISASMALLFALSLFRKLGDSTTYDFNPARELYKYAYPLAFSNLIRTVHRWIDLLLLGYIATSVDVGYYGAALRVGAFSVAILMAFNNVFSPIISDLYNRKQPEELHSLLKVVTRWIFILSYPVFLVLILFAKPIMGLFGTNFKVAGGVLVILAMGQFINAFTGPVGQMVLMSGHSKVVFMNTAVALAINVGLCFLLIPEHGFYGAAIANFVSLSTINLIRVIEVWVYLRMNAYDRSFIKPFLAGVIAVIFVLPARFVFQGEGVMSLLLFAVVLVIVYTIAIVTLGLNEDDRRIMQLFKARLSTR